MTFRKDKNRDSSKAEETTQTDASSSLPMSQRQGPPGNMDPTLGPVDWDEVEMQSFRRVLAELADRDPRPPPGNVDPTLGPIDWDEVEMQDFQAALDNLEEERLAKE